MKLNKFSKLLSVAIACFFTTSTSYSSNQVNFEQMAVARIGAAPHVEQQDDWSDQRPDTTNVAFMDGSYEKGMIAVNFDPSRVVHVYSYEDEKPEEQILSTHPWYKQIRCDCTSISFPKALANCLGLSPQQVIKEGFVDLAITDYSVTKLIMDINPICMTLKSRGQAIFTDYDSVKCFATMEDVLQNKPTPGLFEKLQAVNGGVFQIPYPVNEGKEFQILTYNDWKEVPEQNQVSSYFYNIGNLTYQGGGGHIAVVTRIK